MKKIFTMASLLVLTLSACSDEANKGKTEGIGSVEFSLGFNTEVVDTRAQISCTTPSTEEFALSIKGVSHTFEADFESIAEFNQENYLHEGTYTATVTAGSLSEEGYDMATFVGTQEFTIEARKKSDVVITASIANTLVKVEVTDNFKAYFPGGYNLELTTEAGNSFDVTAQSEALFIAPASFTVNGTATKQPNQSGSQGTVVTLPEYKMESPAAKTLYTIKFDVAEAGSATLQITLNDTLVESVDIERELNDNAQ